MRKAASRQRISGVLSFVLLSFLLSGCGFDPFCSVESYSYRETTPVYLQPDEIDNIESLAPRAVLSTGKIYLHHNMLLVNEPEKGVHVFDNSNPRAPLPLAFIAIPGNHDLLVREDALSTVLYVDSYNDLVALETSNPREITVLKRLANVFSAFYPQDGAEEGKGFLVGHKEGELITEYYRTCGEVVHTPPPSPAPSPGSPGGGGGVSQSGSLARFAVLNDYLYTIDGEAIQSFRLETLANPVLFNRVSVDFGIETLFPHSDETGDQLYVGGNQGLYIMDAGDPGNLRKQGEISHVQACDPVVVQDDLAYVTLQGSCFDERNRLEIIDVADPSTPKLITDYNLQEPYGLGVDDTYLFVCDGAAGLKVYDHARQPNDLELIKQIGDIQPRDVILAGGLAIVVAEDGLFQYDYSRLAQGEMPLLSSIPIARRSD